MRSARVSALLALGCLAAWAHTGEALQPHDLWTTWEFEPGTVIPLLLSAVLYAAGARRRRGVSIPQMLCFWSGWVFLSLALVSPLHPLGEALFSAHMAQHEILMLCAAPLLVLSRPLPALLWGLPFRWRRGVGQWSKSAAVQRIWRLITIPMAAWWIHAVALWSWHAPALFEATLSSDTIHALQHASFLFSALLFWWSLFYARGPGGYGAAVLFVFTTAIHTSILGALLTFSRRIWYPVYELTTGAWGLTPLEDQQIGGLIMWVPAALIYLAAGLWLMAAWLRESDTMAAARRSAFLGMLLMLLTGCGTPLNDQAQRGQAAIGRYGCGSCHTIQGIPGANGRVGPPLTGMRTRVYIAGMLENNPVNMAAWIHDPKAVNPKTAMPKLGVSSRDASDIASYLYSR